jgi:hypothetical protein
MNNSGVVRRALLIGGAPEDAERLARTMAAGGHAIAFAADRVSAEPLKAVFARHDIAAGVMVGDAGLLVHKVAGPFDAIVDAHPGHAGRRERLKALLSADGRLMVATADRKAGSPDE